MAMIQNGPVGLVGNTPLVRLARLEEELGLQAKLYAKLEYLNPTGSVKDRAALWMVNEAEKAGKLTNGGVIIEPTSGNTGIGLAFLGAARGYKVVLTMPETMSAERRALLAAYGAELVLTEGAKGMTGAIEKARELTEETPGSFMPGQFENPANPAAHEAGTGPEIWNDTKGAVDIFVAGVGTGGTVSGVGRYLKRQNPAVHIAAVQPAASPVLNGGKPGPHKIQGIGAGFIPKNYDAAVVDEVLDVEDADAMQMAKRLARTEGLLCGISSGAALSAAARLCQQAKNQGKSLVVLLPDNGDRYLSMGVF